MNVFFLLIILLICPKLWSSELRFDNVDDQIRAAEDPHFAEALIEQQRQIDEERKFAEQQSKIRAQQEAEEERNRLAYIAKRDQETEIQQRERKKNYQAYLQNKQKERALRLAEEEKYFSWREAQNEKMLAQRKEQTALIQSKFARMPASTLEALEHRPRVDRKNEKDKPPAATAEAQPSPLLDLLKSKNLF